MAFAKRSSGPGFTELRRQLADGVTLPVYCLFGDDQLRVRSIVEWMRKTMLGEAGSAFNYHVFDGDECGLDKVIQQCMSFPMMSTVQIIWARRADVLIAGVEEENALCQYFSKPPQETILILSGEKADGRRKWVKLAKSQRYFFEMATPTGRDLVTWLEKAGRERSLALTPDLATLLMELVGEDLPALSNELDKLALSCSDESSRLDEAALQELILQQRPVDPFALVKSLGPGQAGKGIETLRQFLNEGRSVYELAPLLIWRIKQIAQVSALMSEGLDERQLPSALGASPYAVKQAVDVARQWGKQGVQRAFDACADAERTLKSSPLGADQVLERAIMEICREV